MTITLPIGWSTFQGGGIEADLCGEPQDCTTPPCGPIPAITLTGNHTAFECSADIFTITFTINGGVPPFEVSATDGKITIISERTFSLAIHSDSWDFSNTITIGGQANNPCILPAWIYRGQTIYHNSTGGPPASQPCDNQSCVAIAFNCRGDLISSSPIINLNQSLVCDPTKEDLIIAGMDNPAAIQGYGMDYQNCSRYPGGWPVLCIFKLLGSPDPSWVCTGTMSPCPDVTWVSQDFANPGLCTNVTPVTSEDTGGGSDFNLTPLGLLTLTPTVGSFCDVRHAALKATGCAPCLILQDHDIIITITDALGIQAVIDVHVNP